MPTTMAIGQKQTELEARADQELALAYRDFTIEELLWDWRCPINRETRKILEAELKRRRVRFTIP